MRLKIVCPGKSKGPFADLSRQYEKRIAAYAQLALIEAPEVRYVKEPSPKARDRILAEEALGIRSKLDARDHIIALDLGGRRLTSEQFAAYLGDHTTQGISSFTFVIGGSLGLDSSLRAEAHLCLSLSSMTLPHLLARVVLLEQIYRACTILRGEPYHK